MQALRRGGLVLLILLAAPAFANEPAITDGDTIKQDGKIYRLWGIDAPEMKQACGRWLAGVESLDYLRQLIAGKVVECTPRDRDRWGRIVAICTADGENINRQMVRAGMAWAFTKYSYDYYFDELWAQFKRRGVHAHPCIPPWEWRAQARAN